MKHRLLIMLGLYSSLQCQLHFNNPNEVLYFLKKILCPNPVIIEAGGHYGEDTHRMKTIWPEAIIHAFEPLPQSYQRMMKATEKLFDVMCYPYALSTYTGTIDFYIDIPNNAASSIGAPVDWNQHEFNLVPIQVPCITLDAWAEKNAITHIDFMWLDMEGHELHALQHATSLLGSIQAIYTEISFIPIRQGGCLYTDLSTFLAQYGFCLVWQSKSDGRIADALFIKKHLLHD